MKYRDTKTGRYVNKTTWRRSRSHGGTRYKRVRPKPTIRARRIVTPATPPQEIPAEFLELGDDFFESGYESEEEEEYA